MYAIVETSGRQFRVEPGQQIVVDRIQDEEGSEITLERVLLVSDKKLTVGSPLVDGASVSARVVSHQKGDKVIAFKMRRRKRTRRRVGFRHSHTTLEILAINA